MDLGFGWPQAILVAVALQRIVELALSRRNSAALIRRGGREYGASHYPLFVLLHAAWLVALYMLTPPDAPLDWVLITVFVGLQAARIWVIASLGTYWTTRVISVPGAPLVKRGPYRWVRHPNYWVVLAEVVILPLAFGQVVPAVLFGIAKALLLRHRIRVEEAALADRPAS